MKVVRKRLLFCSLLAILIFYSINRNAYAAEDLFDPAYYAAAYQDVVNVFGTDPEALYNHYLNYGMKEGRYPFHGAKPGQPVSGIASNSQAGKFDPYYYASSYADVTASLGTDPEILYQHYLNYGMKEGRYPFHGAKPGQKVDGIKENANAAMIPTVINGSFQPVPLNQLANYKSIKKRMTDSEFQQAYDIAVQIVTPYAGLSREEQMYRIILALNDWYYSNGTEYSMSNDHYNDPYGFFIAGTASCSGTTRATGLCLNILGIPYEHVNENQVNVKPCA